MKTDLMSKSDYTVEDFVLDSLFREWIFANKADAKLYWESYMRKHPEKIKDIEQARTLLIHLSQEKAQISKLEKRQLWENISSEIDRQHDEPSETKVIPMDSWSAIKQFQAEQQKKSRVAWKRKAIAVLLLVGCVGYFLTRTFPEKVPPPPPKLAEMEVLQAPAGVKSTITLEDGSKVFLNSGSKVTYQKGFTDSLRLLTLEGEAFFEVAHDENRPFIVQTGALSTTALGTSFNISSFPGEDIAISLVTGVVLVEKDDSEEKEELHPGEGIQASKDALTWSKNKFDSEKVLSWMDKTLIFNKEPFAKASERLENWFGVEVIFENAIPGDLMVSGKFVDESLENILTGLSYSSRFDYQIQGKKVRIHFKQKPDIL